MPADNLWPTEEEERSLDRAFKAASRRRPTQREVEEMAEAAAKAQQRRQALDARMVVDGWKPPFSPLDYLRYQEQFAAGFADERDPRESDAPPSD